MGMILFGCYFTPAQMAELEAFAEQSNKSKAAIVREALNEWLIKNTEGEDE